MEKIRRILVLVIIGLFTFACAKPPYLTLNSASSLSFGDQGGTQSISFSTNRDWTVSSSASWCKVSPSSGTSADGDIRVTITCGPNTTYDPRNCTLTIGNGELSETIAVEQATNLGLLVSPISYELTNAAQTIEVEVRANVNYAVEIDAACKDWITHVGTKALSSEKITFSIAANESYDNREGKITIKQTDGSLSETIVVKQSQTNGLFITTPEYDLSNEAHTLSVEVKANVEFQVTPQVEWIKYVETRALTSSTIVLSIEANETYDDRTGTVLVKHTNGDLSGTITINQKQTDALLVTPRDVDLDNAEHTVELEVKNNVSYGVVIPDDAKEWISVQSNTATRALADNKVTLAIAQNTTYNNREASITIKQTDGPLAETVKVKQEQLDVIIVGTHQYNISGEEQVLTLDIQANVDINIYSNVRWISQINTKSLETSTITLEVSANETFETRIGTISISNSDGSLQETITISQSFLPPLHVTLDEAGTLINQLTPEQRNTVAGLQINGKVNGTDFLVMKRMSSLIYLDLQSARIVAGGMPYTGNGSDVYTIDDTFSSYLFTETTIKTLIFPKKLDRICERAFWFSPIRVISSIAAETELEREAFYYGSIESIEFEEGRTHLTGTCCCMTPVKTVKLPESLKVIEGGAFRYARQLRTINIPDGIEEIGETAFMEAPLQDVITLPPSVRTIGDNAFRWCGNLKELHIKSRPTTLTNIGNYISDYENVTLYIPKGTYDEYYLTPLGKFKTIVEE